RIDAEAMQPTPHEIVHAGLTHAQQLRGLGLREVAARNQSLEGQHEFCTDAEVLGLHRGKPEVAEDVARAPRGLHCHRSLLIVPFQLLAASSPSPNQLSWSPPSPFRDQS